MWPRSYNYDILLTAVTVSTPGNCLGNNMYCVKRLYLCNSLVIIYLSEFNNKFWKEGVRQNRLLKGSACRTYLTMYMYIVQILYHIYRI